MNAMVTLILMLLAAQSCPGSTKCTQKIMTEPEGTFQSPNFPHRYPVDVTCDYTIKGKSRHYIEITFHDFRLEDPNKGERTDFLEIFDGREKSRQQEVYYDGTMATPFKFISRTSRVIMRFVSNYELNFKGFYATYKALPKPDDCKPETLTITNGKKQCSSAKQFGYVSSCDVLCNRGYQLLGNDEVMCHNGRFEAPPLCVPRVCDPVGCDPDLSIEHGRTNCHGDFENGLANECDVTCDDNYLLLGDDSIKCENGLFFCPPVCRPDLQLMENCVNNMTICPFNVEEIADFYFENQQVDDDPPDEEIEAVFEEMNSTKLTVHRSTGNCPRQFCFYRKKTRTPLMNCKYFSYKVQKLLKFSEHKRREGMIYCLLCQMTNCGFPIVIFT